MTRLLLAATMLIGLQHFARADTSCIAAAEAAEQAWSLPEGLLSAIGRIESGRLDRATGQVMASPWAINAQGRDYFFDDKASAIAAVEAMAMRGIRSIDIGCFQINIMHHPTAFASLEEGFDPASNAAYAARFLRDLRARGGSWETAIAWYHSATPGVGDAYRDKVMASWNGSVAAGSTREVPAAPTEPPVDRYVVVAGSAASGVRVWVPAALATQAARTPPRPAAAAARPGVPAVITPSAGRLAGANTVPMPIGAMPAGSAAAIASRPFAVMAPFPASVPFAGGIMISVRGASSPGVPRFITPRG